MDLIRRPGLLGATAAFILVASVFDSGRLSSATQTPANSGQQQQRGQPSENRYTQEPAVFERFSVDESFEADGSSVVTSTFRVRVQSAAAVKQFGTLAVPYRRDDGTPEILTARVLKADGTTIETPAANAIDVPAGVTQDAPVFTDVYLRNLNVRSLSAGDTLEVSYRRRSASLLPGYFWTEQDLVDDVIVLDGNLTISVPASHTPIVKSLAAQPSVSTSDGRRIYSWHYTTLTLPTGKEAEA